MKSLTAIIFILGLAAFSAPQARCVENPADKPKAMWIDTDANFELLSSKANIDAELEKVKSYGMNMVYVDIKPSNGFALYKSDILTYCNSFGEKTVERDYDDYLGYIIEKCDRLGLDVVASVCAMGWGWHKGDKTQGLIYEQWDKWKDKVQVRSDNDDPQLTVAITADSLQEHMMLDPIYPEVQQLLVDVCKEIVTKYPRLKGISLDYLRYNNNDGGWFGMSDDNMRAYAGYWKESVPDRHEIVTAEGGVGPKFAKWIEFRSAVVRQTLSRVRDAVKSVRPDCEIHMWASAEWSSRFSVGQNWASRRYKPAGYAYTDTYSRTGFADLLDVFVTGAYSDKVWIKDNPTSEWTVENFCSRSGDYIMGDCRCYGSIAAYALDRPSISEAAGLCLKHNDGCMVFELSHINNGKKWDALKRVFDLNRNERNN